MRIRRTPLLVSYFFYCVLHLVAASDLRFFGTEIETTVAPLKPPPTARAPVPSLHTKKNKRNKTLVFICSPLTQHTDAITERTGIVKERRVTAARAADKSS
ncbi:hypothetical protein EVAR_75532_1 [Eumeta japonica]|uniref:Secreted protein n=1 Tax=Eumeta variegata TaxID=151549 RepID=A0A4C1UJQ1_EUMVA|nr:hypothetical protein EVAR_75532_1 [Eumeta japonica]